MAKNLKAAETIDSPYGDVWDSAILVADFMELNFHTQTLVFRAQMYKDAAARTANDGSIQETHYVDKATFLAEFDLDAPATQLKGQCEDFALTLVSQVLGVPFGDKFE